MITTLLRRLRRLSPLLALLIITSSQVASAAEPPSAPVTVISVAADDAGPGLQLRLSALGSDFELSLLPSAALADVELLDAQLGDTLFYAGSIVGDDYSWARLTRHAGVFTGTLRAWGRLYRIDRQQPLGSRNSEQTVMTDITDGDRGEAHGFDAALLPPTAVRSLSLDGTPRTPLPRALRNSAAPSRVIHVGALIDTLFDEHYNGAGALRALSVLNSVDGIFREELSVALHISVVKVLTDPLNDPMRSAAELHGGSANKVLDAFVEYRRDDSDLPGELGVVHLFSGASDPNDIIGLAWIDTVCRSDGYDTSLSTPFFYDVQLAAHELGHNLGALHDDQTDCAAETDQLMWPAFTPQMQSHFTQCSADAMAARIAASCNDDNVDLSIQLAGGSDIGEGQITEVALLVGNRDAIRTAPAVISETSLPASLQLATIPSGCSLNNQLLRCAHGDLPAGANATLTLRLLALSAGEPLISSRVSASGVYDLSSSDNLFELRLGAIPAAASSPTGGGGGGGSAGWLWLLMTAFAGWRHAARRYAR